MKRVALVVGARPNLVKAAALVPAFTAAGIEVCTIHTGQHSDPAMRARLLAELDLRVDKFLSLDNFGNGLWLGEMITQLARVIAPVSPDCVVVVGDCDSTLAGALVARKLRYRLAHVEAGLRATDAIQENLNRILVDRMSEFLFCSERDGMWNLIAQQGELNQQTHLVGNVMVDTLRRFHPLKPLHEVFKPARQYAVLTLHRAETVDDPEKLRAALEAIRPVAEKMPVNFPIHPRTRRTLQPLLGEEFLKPWGGNVVCREPLGYHEFIDLIASATVVLTDSGGVQEETTALRRPCLTLREQTERPCTVEYGTNELVGFSSAKVGAALEEILSGKREGMLHRPEIACWDGHAADRIADVLKNN